MIDRLVLENVEVTPDRLVVYSSMTASKWQPTTRSTYLTHLDRRNAHSADARREP